MARRRAPAVRSADAWRCRLAGCRDGNGVHDPASHRPRYEQPSGGRQRKPERHDVQGEKRERDVSHDGMEQERSGQRNVDRDREAASEVRERHGDPERQSQWSAGLTRRETMTILFN